MNVKLQKDFAPPPDGPFNGSNCNIQLMVPDFINQMSVLYTKVFIFWNEFAML